jgi:methionyl-tRNA synthetase
MTIETITPPATTDQQTAGTGSAANPSLAAPAPANPTEASPVPPEDLVDIDYFAKVKLRVARVEHAEAIPKSKKLLKLQLDLGPLGKRQILAGVALHYTPESLIGKKIVVVANLKPAQLMGHESQGMLLAASSEDGSKLIIVNPGEEMDPGATVR